MLKLEKEDVDIILTQFFYDETSPSGIMRKTNNSPSGGITENGYYRTRISKTKKVFNHIMVWVIHNGIPTGKIDHIDGIRTNNKLSNLRCVSDLHNAHNRSKQKNNSSGTNSLFYEERNSRSPRYRAICTFNNKRYSKSFSISKYGDDAKNEAEQWIKMIRTNFNQNGADFTERHGR